MKRRLHRVAVVTVLVCVLLTLCACSLSVEELYQLPQLSDRYFQLQGLIDEILNMGASYSPPTSGTHRQSVELKDLDGDNVNEAISFFRITSDETPLKVIIFRYINGEYQRAAEIKCEGESINSISYSDMDGDGQLEIIIGCQISPELKMLSIYSITDFNPYLLGNTAYTDYALCGLKDSGENVFVVNLLGAEQPNEALLLSLNPSGEIDTESAAISQSANAVVKIQTSRTSNGTNAVYVDEAAEDGYFTEIFTYQGKVFTNITVMDSETGRPDTFRQQQVSSTDINIDGVLDIPLTAKLKSSVDSSTCYAIRWISYSALGNTDEVLTTFNNEADGWYFIMPDKWLDNISVRRENAFGVRSVIFSIDTDDQVADFIAISTITGDNRRDNPKSDSRFTIRSNGGIVYTGEIFISEGSPLSVSKELITSNFKLIYSDWGTDNK